MDFLPEEIEKFVEKYTEKESPVLAELNHETWEKALMPRMLSGHIQGRILSMFSHMIQPKTILEIGTYTGYSALCLSEGLKQDGKLITIDINEELEPIVRKYIAKAGKEEQIDYRIGNALDIIPTLNVTFDLVFIDADKTNYSNYFDLVIDKVAQNGYIIADNVLWSGKVTQPYETLDADTKALVDYCEKVEHDNRVQNVLFPVRDGLMVCRKL
jgi:predicted O-methyltransferase YrrM